MDRVKVGDGELACEELGVETVGVMADMVNLLC
jgi:hypothetical protein